MFRATAMVVRTELGFGGQHVPDQPAVLGALLPIRHDIGALLPIVAFISSFVVLISSFALIISHHLAQG